MDATQQTTLEAPSVATVYFCEFQFASATLYVNTTNQSIVWGGHEWIGMGAVTSITSVEESEGLEPKSMSFTLNSASPSLIAIAVGSVEEYRGHPTKMYFCPLDSGYQLVGTPEICWRGIMDALSIGVEGDSGSIVLKCETSAYGLKRRPQFRLNAAQQKLKHPTDTGFDYLNDLIAKPSLWLSRRFQTV